MLLQPAFAVTMYAVTCRMRRGCVLYQACAKLLLVTFLDHGRLRHIRSVDMYAPVAEMEDATVLGTVESNLVLVRFQSGARNLRSWHRAGRVFFYPCVLPATERNLLNTGYLGTHCSVFAYLRSLQCRHEICLHHAVMSKSSKSLVLISGTLRMPSTKVDHQIACWVDKKNNSLQVCWPDGS